MAKSRNSKIAPIGKRFGLVTICGPSRTGKSNSTIVPARCDCGDMREYFVSNLARQSKPMCPACRLLSRPSKGMHRHPLFAIWKAMIQRCENPNHDAFCLYGGRGISICERWRSDFNAFVEDVGDRPTLKHTIDRIDTNGNYEPNNCRWATGLEQGNNRRKQFHAYIEWRGERLTLANAAREAGISSELLRWRLSRGWAVDRAMTQPVRGRPLILPD